MPVIPPGVDIPSDLDIVVRGLFDERVSILLSTVTAMDCVFPVQALNACAAANGMQPGDRNTILVCRDEVKELVSCIQKSEEGNLMFLRQIQEAGRKYCTDEYEAFGMCCDEKGRSSKLLESCKKEHRAFMECGAQVVMDNLFSIQEQKAELRKQRGEEEKE